MNQPRCNKRVFFILHDLPARLTICGSLTGEDRGLEILIKFLPLISASVFILNP
jgi:hypothetical protein